MDIDEVLGSGAFSGLDDGQKKAFKNLMEQLSGKSVSEAMPLIMSFMASMPKTGPQTPEQQRAMADTLAASLPEAERVKFRSLLQLMAQMKK